MNVITNQPILEKQKFKIKQLKQTEKERENIQCCP
jgi:hypothetical protein